MQVRSNADGGGDKDEVFDDVLADKGGDKGCLPTFAGEEDEREKRRDHVNEQERDHDAFSAFDDEEDADETLKECKAYIKRMKGKDSGKRAIKESVYQ
jgi:hypothetical protein